MMQLLKKFLITSHLFILPIQTVLAGAVLENPLAFGSITDLLAAILGVVMVLATPIVVFFIIYAGFLYVTARGNVQQVQQATTALTYAVIGGLLILGSFALAEIIKNVVDEFRA